MSKNVSKMAVSTLIAITAISVTCPAFGQTVAGQGAGDPATEACVQNIGLGNVVCGNGSSATGDGNTAIGPGATVSGQASTAISQGAEASGVGAIAVGSFATTTVTRATPTTPAVGAQGAIAIGSSENPNSVFNPGQRTTAIGTNSIAIGTAAQATGTAAISIGLGSQSGEFSTAIGSGSRATGGASPGATAIGAGSQANLDGTATGRGSSATGRGSTANGSFARATAENSVALGAGSLADVANTVSVGSATQQRQIVNMAAGAVTATSTDAINGSQLFATNSRVSALEALNLNVGSQISGLQSGINSLSDQLNLNNRQANGGIAAALALGGAAIVPDSNVSMSFNLSTYRGQQGFSGSLIGRVSEKVYVSGGFAGSTVKGSTGGRVGVTFGW
jgi:trimeric autotransporter adhesin